jgi:hypothetical protein
LLVAGDRGRIDRSEVGMMIVDNFMPLVMVVGVLAARLVLIVAAFVISYLLFRTVDLLERIAVTLDRMETRDRGDRGP